MAQAVDPRSQYTLYPMPISTSGLPSSSKAHYNYTYATPASTPTKPYPSYFYHYRAASPTPRSIRRTSASVPNLCVAASSPPPPAARPSPLSVPLKSYSRSREEPTLRSHAPIDSPRSVQKEDKGSSSTQGEKHQQHEDAHARQARLIAEREATLKRMEERQLEAEIQPWFEESQRLAAEAARIQREELKKAEEKLGRVAQERAEEERKARVHKQEQERERGRSRDWHDRGREDSHKGKHGFERAQRRQHEQTKSDSRPREAGEIRERVNKGGSRRSSSPSSVTSAWATYEEACAELMHAKPPKGKVSGRVTFYDISWPVLGKASSFHDLTNENIAAFLLSPHHSQGKSPKARLRAAILIWHPDKFAQKVFPHIAESHRLAVSAAVDIVARILTELMSSHGN